MSRDWAPFEHYLSEQWQIKQGYGSFWEITESLEIHLDGKEPQRMYSDEEIALRRRFPFIGRFLFDDFPKLYGQLSEIEGGIDFLHAKDLELATFLEASKVIESGPNHFVLKVDDIGADSDNERHYYVDFKPELIKPLSLEALLKKQFGEILEYDTNAKERFEDLFDVMTPQECADLFGKPVKCGDEIFMPKENNKVALDEQINVAADKVTHAREDSTGRSIESER